MYIYRWDLDKTYLDTDFDSLRGLMRSATEPAAQKRAVPGATALMRRLGEREGARIFILSGSPTQLRAVLEEKLRLDGVGFESLMLKDNLGNLRRGRLRAIRGQVGYKLPALLAGRVGLGAGVRETLFGDDAESDALIYSIYADTLTGRLSPADLSRLLEASGAYPDNIELALSAVSRISTANAVDRIFIRLARGAPRARFSPLGARLVPIHAWWQAALVLAWLGHVPASTPDEVYAEAPPPGEAFAAASLAQDLVRGGHLPAAALPDLIGDAALRGTVAAALGRLGPLPPEPVPLPPTAQDDLALVRAWSHKG